VYSRRVRRIVLLAVLLIAPSAAGRAQPLSVPPDEQAVHEIAAQLRCVVCQNLSVADSPSEMAAQMRGVIRERLAAGDRPDHVVQYFVDKYGEWILLSPRRQGFTLLVWIVPAAAAAAGLAITAWLIRGWSRERDGATAASPAIDPAMSERIRREIEST
jgi:cytochrome c-type biogenesis protein CcmH